MKLQVAVAVCLLGLCDVLTRSAGAAAAETDVDATDVDKRRGWGKRDGGDVASSLDGIVDKRRGWGKREPSLLQSELVEKRRGWGKRSDASPLQADFDALGEMEKRRGWGKRSGPIDALEEMDKRRGWGKRGAASSSELMMDEDDLSKRRGWGKRTMAFGEMDKKRGWGKRSGAMDEETEAVDKRRGWGKRGWGKRGAPESVCEELQDQVFVYVYKAVAAEAKRISQCDNVVKE